MTDVATSWRERAGGHGPGFALLLLALYEVLARNRIPSGRSVQAVGGNRDAAGPIGLPAQRTRTMVYVVSGLTGILTPALPGGGRQARIGGAHGWSAAVVASTPAGA